MVSFVNPIFLIKKPEVLVHIVHLTDDSAIDVLFTCLLYHHFSITSLSNRSNKQRNVIRKNSFPLSRFYFASSWAARQGQAGPPPSPLDAHILNNWCSISSLNKHQSRICLPFRQADPLSFLVRVSKNT